MENGKLFRTTLRQREKTCDNESDDSECDNNYSGTQLIQSSMGHKNLAIY